MKIRVLLYKAKWGDKSIVDNLISIWTRSKYSHIEIWTPEVTDNDIELFQYSEVIHNDRNLQDKVIRELRGTCWTSTMRGEDNGTVKRDASGVLKNAGRWDYIELDIVFVTDMLKYMEREVDANMGYSKWDILKFVSPIHRPDNKRNICSEFVNNALFHAGIVFGYGIVSPKKVYKKLIKLGYEARRLG